MNYRTVIFRSFSIVLAFFIASIAYAQPKINMDFNTDNYTKEWKEIDALRDKQRPASLEKKVKELYLRAKADNNPAQVVKTLIYWLDATSQLNENSDLKIYQELNAEIANAAFPVRSILHSVMGEYLSNYASQRAYQIGERTPIEDYTSKPIDTWTLEQLIEQSNLHYLASTQEVKLQNVPINIVDALTTEGRGSDNLRPDLYAFLVNRALTHFGNSFYFLSTPTNAFQLNTPNSFGDVEQFTNIDWKATDNTALTYRAVVLYQDWLRLLASGDQTDALVIANLQRLDFINQHSALSNKEELYLSALEKMAEKYKKNPYTSEVLYRIATQYNNRGNKYVAGGDDTYQFDKQKAKEIAQNTIRDYPNTYGSEMCLSLLQNIEATSLELKIESVVPAQKASLYRLDYRNIKEVYVKVIEINEDDFLRQDWYGNNKIDALNKNKVVWTKTETLPNKEDHQTHGVEGAIDALNKGIYAVLVADNKEFSNETGVVSVAAFTVSDLAYIGRSDSSNGVADLLVVNRTTGAPQAGVTVDFYKSEYNRLKRRNVRVKIKTFTSDQNGRIQSTNIVDRGSFSFVMRKGNDVLYSEREYSIYRSNRTRKEIETTHFFLDRAIYRPGQTLYFKALSITKNPEGTPRINANQEVVITLLDVNYQEVAKQTFTTNEYGTINGTFTLPNAGLRGQMQLKSSVGGNSQYFKVEEYKRPQFEVTTNPLEGEYKLGEEVKVTGQAKAFAGNSVSGAKVTYRVTRNVRYPWWPWWRGYRPSYGGSNAEITSGETVTDDEGKFEVIFTAIPDQTVDTKYTPAFYYTVSVDVIDITGETHSTSTGVEVSNRSLLATISIDDVVDKATDDLSIQISTTNLNGAFVAAKGEITISKLVKPKQQFIERYWARPDLELMRKKAFKQQFPMLAYRNEDKKQNWAVEKQKTSLPFNTADTTLVNIDIDRWNVGTYLVELKTTDKNGNEIILKEYVDIKDEAKGDFPSMENYLNVTTTDACKVGDTKEIHLYNTSKMATYVFLEDTSTGSGEWVKLDKQYRKKITPQELDRGGFVWQTAYVKHNRVHIERNQVSVPWEKNLDISLATYRDKLQPGQDEEWSIIVKGPDGDGIIAELAAGMYDASLDQFVMHSWRTPYLWQAQNQHLLSWNSSSFEMRNGYSLSSGRPYIKHKQERTYRDMNYFSLAWIYGSNNYAMGYMSMEMEDAAVPMTANAAPKMRGARKNDGLDYKSAEPMLDSDVLMQADDVEEPSAGESPAKGEISIRKNLKETVFFKPTIYTDSEGNAVLKFKMNEALTRWKLLLFGHTKDLNMGNQTQEVVTQKELMIQPNVPRFVREGDKITLTAKVSNLTAKNQAGEATLLLFDGLTMRPVDKTLGNSISNKAFDVAANGTALVSWDIYIPAGKVSALKYQVLATTDQFSDGEENIIPVVTNRKLVTETMPMVVMRGETKTFTFEEMTNRSSSTLEHHKATLEFSSNPVWSAVKALPYLMEYPYNCSEQIFSRYYANTLATSVANSHPEIKRVLDSWKGSDALDSELTKNEELKSALLKETPWVLDAADETQQRHNIALLFDLNRMANEQQHALTQLQDRQSNNGGFSWFPGGRESQYITQYIVEGLGRLQHLGATPTNDQSTQNMINKAIRFIDEELVYNYEELKKQKKVNMDDDHLSNTAIHYLYTRSFFDVTMDVKLQKVVDYYRGQAQKYWNKKGLYQQGLIALALYRNNPKNTTVEEMITSFRERALHHEEKGMYWKFNSGYNWYQMPIETQSLMVEVFSEITKNTKEVDELKLWLLCNKETNNWKTTKATANATYALLMNGSNWIAESSNVVITMPKATIENEQIEAALASAEAGTGYLKTSWEAVDVTEELATIKVENKNSAVSWGSFYWQYFEDLDKIKTFEETPLQLKKQLYKVIVTEKGEELVRIKSDDVLAPGTKVKVRIELRVDRAMEYVHMKDMRAAGFEPMNVFSQYKWQDGLGYYESTGDLATDFFFDLLRPGTYVFEYPIRVVHKGDFSNGVTTIQCMYAPKYTSHSAGVRVSVK